MPSGPTRDPWGMTPCSTCAISVMETVSTTEMDDGT